MIARPETFAELIVARGRHARLGYARDIGLAVLALAGVMAAAVLGQIATFPNLVPWYAGLAKPAFTPPAWLFGPAWTALYLLMAFAAWRVLRLREGWSLSRVSPLRRRGLGLFLLQLVLNAAWPWLFFAAHSPLLGLIDILPQLLAILATIAAFRRLDGPAAAGLMPLAAWVAFATAVNFEIWRLNG
jgi:tryptophan-rich sensory protein